MMNVYIKHNVKGHFVELQVLLSEEMYDNIGDTWEDFIDNKWVLLSEAQAAFHNEHPEAKASEVWNMELDPIHERDLEDAKREMIGRIESYDTSDAVNGFLINGALNTWFSVQERLNYKESINAAKLLGKDEVSFFIGDTMLTIGCDMAIGMLAQIQDYADRCFIVTKQHKLAVEALESIEDVDNFDYTAGYPEKINFNLA